MSFGFSLSDLIALVSLSQKTYDGWRNAPKEYKDVVQTVRQGRALVSHIHRRFDVLSAKETKSVQERGIVDSLRGCNDALQDLHDIVKQNHKLGHWNRVKMSASKISHAKDRLAQHIGMTTPLLLSLELESIGKDTSLLPAMLDRIPGIIAHALPIALGQMIDARSEDVRSAKSSVMTTYGDDDKQAYRELRRQLISCGIKDLTIREQRGRLVRFAKSLVTDTVGDREAPESGADCASINAKPTSGARDESSSERSGKKAMRKVDTDFAQSHAVPLAAEPHGPDDQRYLYQASCETDDESDVTENPLTKGPIDGPLLELIDENPSLTTSSVEAVMSASETLNRVQEAPTCYHSSDASEPAHFDFTCKTGQEFPTMPAPVAEEMTARREWLSVSEDDHVQGLNPKGPLSTTAVYGDFPIQREPIDSPSSDVYSSDGDWSHVAYSLGSRDLRRRPQATDRQNNYDRVASWPDVDYGEPDSDTDSNSRWSAPEFHSGAEDDPSIRACHGGSDDKSTQSPWDSSDGRPGFIDVDEGYHAQSPSGQPAPFYEGYPEPPPRAQCFGKIVRRIEYRPLDPEKDGRLILRVQLPMGELLSIENGVRGKEPRFRHESEPDKWWTSFPDKDKTPIVWRVSDVPCWHTFPCDPLKLRGIDDGDLQAECGCQVIYWTQEMQRLSPSFLEDLRRWIGWVDREQ